MIQFDNGVLEKYTYDKETGILYNKVTKKEVGGKDFYGYLTTTYKQKKTKVHRIIWYIIYGSNAKNGIDHINHIKDDNRPENLRDVTHRENCLNLSLKKNNTSGVNGVWYHKRTDSWVAEIKVKYKKTHLGYFKDKKDAIKARKDADIKYSFNTNHGKVYD